MGRKILEVTVLSPNVWAGVCNYFPHWILKFRDSSAEDRGVGQYFLWISETILYLGRYLNNFLKISDKVDPICIHVTGNPL